MYRSLGFVCLLVAAVVGQAAELPEMPAAPRPAPGALVNCNNGESIQAAVDAVDASIGPVEIRISGICVENVLIRDKDVSLRGAQSPALDGIRSADPATSALVVRGSVIAEINDLSFSQSAGTAVMIRGGATMWIGNSRFENNGKVGLRVDSGAMVIANGLTFTANPDTNTSTSDAQFFCTACDFNGGGVAAVSTRNAFVSLRDSVITGVLGIVADQNGAFVDLDCSVNTPHPCSIDVAVAAAIGAVSSTAVLTDAGGFTGQLIADDRGTVRLNGSQQRLAAGNGAPNIVDNLGEIIVAPLGGTASALRSTLAFHFGRVLLTDNSVLSGSIQCSGAAEAFLDPSVVRLQGSSVTGCTTTLR